MTTLVPAGPYLATTLTDSGGPLDHDVVHQAIADATAELQTATALHGGLLGVKVWSTGSSAYVWSGDGSAPSSGAFTQILFIDPTGTHDPSTSTGGRSNSNDLWEVGVSDTPLAALHAALLGVKVWSTGSNAYVWSGDGSAPDASSYTQILFIDSTASHDPKTSAGGRDNANDLWETGGGSGTPIIPQSTHTASYTLALADTGTCVEMNVATANTLSVPTDAAVGFAIGSRVEVYQAGAGQVTVSPAGGVTLRAPNGAKSAMQYSTMSLRKRATDEWVLSGDTSV